MKTYLIKSNKQIALLAAVLFCFLFSTSCENEEYKYTEIQYLGISGVTSATAQSTKDFYTFYLEDANYVWAVPSGSTISSGQGTSHIKVLFGTTGGTISVEAKGMRAEKVIKII